MQSSCTSTLSFLMDFFLRVQVYFSSNEQNFININTRKQKHWNWSVYGSFRETIQDEGDINIKKKEMFRNLTGSSLRKNQKVGIILLFLPQKLFISYFSLLPLLNVELMRKSSHSYLRVKSKGKGWDSKDHLISKRYVAVLSYVGVFWGQYVRRCKVINVGEVPSKPPSRFYLLSRKQVQCRV